jgi:ferric-dicitrate binding protein FerR (iron transport regulator)
MKEKIDYQLLKNFSEGKYSFRDLKRITVWFEEPSYRNEIESAIHQHWNDFAVNKDEAQRDLSIIFDNLREQIRLEQPQPVAISRRIVTVYSKIAAVLLLPLLLYFAFTLVNLQSKEATAWAEIYAPPGARTQFFLPDGSKGWLNSNTKLKYPLNFVHNRHINLSGEAYFEVKKDKDYPFVVSTPYLEVKVIGTVFSISALKEENMTEVVLQKGAVEIDNPDLGLKSLMQPDQKFVFDNIKKSYQSSKINAQLYNAWKDGLLIFRNEPLSEVFKRLGRWYNVNITITDEQIKGYKYRATFQNEPIEEVIRLIALTVPIEYRIEKRSYDEQGVFAVREIKIMKK